MNPLIVIPARMGSTRLPGKMMADIAGKPMIQHVYERCAQANVAPVLVACDTQEIKDLIESVGGKAILTDPELPSGSDRVCAAVKAFDPHEAYDVVVNVQGDQPTLEAILLAAVLRPLTNADVHIATVATPIVDMTEKESPHVVKIALGGVPGAPIRRALYFSRACIPSGEGEFFHHMGIYAYRRKALNRFVKLPATNLEGRERLEQLRALEDGMRIDVCLVEHINPLSVDYEGDLAEARRRLGA
ncbi:MAG: 3-deoxy-manno-octulosonate cytidylyltransferase [Alphaproteobacteria bacterium]|jgi:3-deoxy-manno-octulosonate cytidylyltransferase (CMP-KDO synthetase)|nr:3-deoxy-manno-octulosonate cytidylyltransferase [Alphaproteobacteria bacterium]